MKGETRLKANQINDVLELLVGKTTNLDKNNILSEAELKENFELIGFLIEELLDKITDIIIFDKKDKDGNIRPLYNLAVEFLQKLNNTTGYFMEMEELEKWASKPH